MTTMSNNKTFKEHWDEIAQWFDFNKVHKAMTALEWTWVRCDGTPPIGYLVESARGLCENCYERANQRPSRECSSGIGGFHASYSAVEDIMTLSFTVCDWSTNTTDDD